jgi:hypothetical protein
MLLLLLIIIAVIALPTLAYTEYLRWRGRVYRVEPPFDRTNHDPPKPPDHPKRLPNITDVGGAD